MPRNQTPVHDTFANKAETIKGTLFFVFLLMAMTALIGCGDSDSKPSSPFKGDWIVEDASSLQLSSAQDEAHPHSIETLRIGGNGSLALIGLMLDSTKNIGSVNEDGEVEMSDEGQAEFKNQSALLVESSKLHLELKKTEEKKLELIIRDVNESGSILLESSYKKTTQVELGRFQDNRMNQAQNSGDLIEYLASLGPLKLLAKYRKNGLGNNQARQYMGNAESLNSFMNWTGVNIRSYCHELKEIRFERNSKVLINQSFRGSYVEPPLSPNKDRGGVSAMFGIKNCEDDHIQPYWGFSEWYFAPALQTQVLFISFADDPATQESLRDLIAKSKADGEGIDEANRDQAPYIIYTFVPSAKFEGAAQRLKDLKGR